MKFEVRTKDPETLTYGIWNNDMLAFQYITAWDGTETLDLEEANKVCERRNFKHGYGLASFYN